MTTTTIPMSADSLMYSATATTNYGSNVSIQIGALGAGTGIARTWIKPDFSTIPSGDVFSSAILKLTPTGDSSSNARTMRAHRCLRDPVEAQITWNIFKTSNNWGTAGASNSTTDYEGAVELGNMSVPASPTLNTPLSMTLDHEELQKLFDGTYTNNGIILFVDTQNTDLITYASTNNATSAYRPVIEIVHAALNNGYGWW